MTKGDAIMPHVILECSDNIIEQLHVSSLFAEIHLILEKQLPTQLSSCKSRCVVHNLFYLGDGDKANAFLHLTVKVLAGRTNEVKNQLGEHLLKLLGEHVQSYKNKSGLQLSIEILDLNEHYFKG